MSPSTQAALAAGAAVLFAVAAIQGVVPVVVLARTRRRRGSRAPATSSGPPSRRVVSGVRVRRTIADVALGGEARRRRRADHDLPSFLDQVSRQLRSGAALPGAVQAAASGRDEPSTARLALELAGRTPLATAVHDWHRACPTPARQLAAAALALAADAGGSVAAVLDGVSETLRDRVALDREVAALSSQARASAAVLVVAPVVFAVLAGAADPRVAHTLLTEPLGWACLAAGVGLDAVGALWMARLVGRVR